MSARRQDQPFTRGSTVATVIVVVFVVGTIAIGVAYLGNREWGNAAVAERTGVEADHEADDVQGTADKAERSNTPAGDGRPDAPRVNELFKSPLDDAKPAPQAPLLFTEADNQFVTDASAAAQPAESEPADRPLPQPTLSITDNSQAEATELDEVVLPDEPLLKGPRLADPYEDLEEVESDLYSEFDPDFQAGSSAAAGALSGQQAPPADKPRPEADERIAEPADPEETEVARPVTEADRIEPRDVATSPQQETLAAAARSTGQFATFLKLAEAAELATLLEGQQFHTVVAPTDRAFDALPAGTVAALLRPEHRAKLEALVKFHVISGNHSAGALSNRRHISALNGQRLKLDVDGLTLKVAGAPLAMPSIACSNGMLHGVDELLLPVADDLTGVLEVEGQFSTLIQLLKQTGLHDALADGDDVLTLFAPTDEAFERVPTDLLARLVQPENEQLLKSVLMHHIGEGRLYSQALLSGEAPRSLEGSRLDPAAIAAQSGQGQQLIATTDLEATNGVVHKVNRVLLPPRIETTLLKPVERTAQSPDAAPRARWQAALETAVADGKQLYQDGAHAACADRYEETIRQLLQTTDEAELPQARTALLDALTASDRQETSTGRAWVLRRGINRAYGELFD